MSTSRATIRLIALLFLLAGLVLLRKPVFGQAITVAPQIACPEKPVHLRTPNSDYGQAQLANRPTSPNNPRNIGLSLNVSGNAIATHES